METKYWSGFGCLLDGKFSINLPMEWSTLWDCNRPNWMCVNLYLVMFQQQWTFCIENTYHIKLYIVYTERVCDLYMQQIKSLIRCEYGHIWLHCCIYIRKEMEQYRRCEKPVSTQPKRFRSKISSDDDHDRMTLTSESRSHLVWAFEWEIWKCNTPPF